MSTNLAGNDFDTIRYIIQEKKWRNAKENFEIPVATNNGILPKPYSKKIQNDYIHSKSKSMAMWRNHIQRVKIVINDNIIEHVKF